MTARIKSAKMENGSVVQVTVEAEVIDKGVGIHLVGLADREVKESLLRVITALMSKGYRCPGQKLMLNVAPEDLCRCVTKYDLAFALAIVQASGQETFPHPEDCLVLGELGLDGTVRGVYDAEKYVALAASFGIPNVILPEQDSPKGVDGVNVYGVKTLGDAVEIMRKIKK